MSRLRRKISRILDRLGSDADWSNDDPPGPVDALVATILSQNTSDLNSERAYRQLIDRYGSWDDVAGADPRVLEETIRSAGLAEQKTGTILRALHTLRERHGGLDLAPFDSRSDDELLDELTSIKGIGLKTAACVLMFSLDRDLCAVDTHVHRVANRLGLVSAKTPDTTFEQLRGQAPPGRSRNLHVALIRFGRHVCKAQRPHCFECPLFDLCEWEPRRAIAESALRGARAVSGDRVLSDVMRRRDQR